MQLFYTPDISLPEEESAHCMKVLRLRTGDELHLTDGCGNLYRATVLQPDPKHCRVRITETLPEYGKRSYGVTVAVAPTKNTDRYEWFLEKATETGIDRIIPIECRRSERRTLKRERGERVVTSAVKQSLKAYRPQLDELTPVEEVIGIPFDGVKLIAHCRPDTQRRFIGDALPRGGNVLVLIGPEGDFSDEEITAARAAGRRDRRSAHKRHETAGTPEGNGDSVMKKELRHIRNVQPKGTGSLRVCLSLFTTFFKIGAFTFGGGFAMIPLIEREMIDRRGWIARGDFLELLTLAQSAPGPIALNSAVFVGYKIAGYRGAFSAVAGVVLPSFVIILLIAIYFTDIRENRYVDAAFKGMRPAVIALIAAPILNLARGMVWWKIALAAIAAVIVWQLGVSPVWFIIAGAAAGILHALHDKRGTAGNGKEGMQ